MAAPKENSPLETLETINLLDDNIARAIRISKKLERGTSIEELSQEELNLINALKGLKDPTRDEHEDEDEGDIVREGTAKKLDALGI